MVEDMRLDSKLTDLQRELMARPLLPGFRATDAFTMRGIDEGGKPGMFAAVLLAANPVPELETLTSIRAMLTQRLKQLDTTIPAWPIVVQGAPELIDGETVVPGGPEHFFELKRNLEARRQKPRAAYPQEPIIVDPELEAAAAAATANAASAKPSAKIAKARKATAVKKGARRSPAARSARTVKPAKAARRK